METDMPRARRHQKQNHRRPSDNDSYHSDYSIEDRDEDDYNDVPENVTRGKHARGRQRPSENRRYSDAESSMTLEVPPGHVRPSRKAYLHHSSGDDSRAVGRSPQRNAPTQNTTRSQQGSYAERFNKQKGAGSVNGKSSYPQSGPADMDQYSDEESPRQPPGQVGRGRGRGRSRFPTRGQQGREWDRRQMR